MKSMDIHELVARIALELSREDVEQPSGRVSEVPSLRTLRYYISHGLLDKPVGQRGRRALYGERHVLQVLAIKQLQARGSSLAEVQERLVGLRDHELATIAGRVLPDSLEEIEEEQDSPRGDFWSRQPAPIGASEVAASGPSLEPASSGEVAGRERVGPQALRLSEELLLVIEGGLRPLEDEDRQAIEAAAEPLKRLLQARYLLERDP